MELEGRSSDGLAQIVESSRDAEVHVLLSTKSRWRFWPSFPHVLEREASVATKPPVAQDTIDAERLSADPGSIA
jgi:hypothetical protein